MGIVIQMPDDEDKAKKEAQLRAVIAIPCYALMVALSVITIVSKGWIVYGNYLALPYAAISFYFLYYVLKPLP